MLHNDRKPLLAQGAVERLIVELVAMSQLHKNMAKMYDKHCFEEAKYIEHVQAGWYRKFCMELKGLGR